MIDPLADMFRSDPSIEFVDFGGIEIVNTFGQPALEYSAICKGCGLMSFPQRGAIELSGADRHAFLGNLLTNKTFDLTQKRGMDLNTVVPSLLLNLKGRIVSEMNVIELGERLLIETDARQTPMLAKLLDRYLFTEKVKIVDRSDSLFEIALMGERAESILKEFFQIDSVPSNSRSASLTTHNSKQATLFRDDITASPCFFLLVDRASAATIWKQLIERFSIEREDQPAKRRLRPVGWAAFNACRIEAGRTVAGIDYEIAEPSMPGGKKDREAGDLSAHAMGLLPAELNDVARVVDFNKGCYLGQEMVARMHARKIVARKIVGWRASDDTLPIAGAPVTNEAGDQIGIVTSSTFSPRLGNVAIGLALVKKPHFEIDSRLTVPAEGSMTIIKVVSTPFV